ncbi:MAG: inositol monophosphatase [Terriglobales bacterium]
MKTPYLTTAIQAAHEGGKVLRAFYGRLDHVWRKDSSFREITSEVDTLSEREIMRVLHEAYPESALWSEEAGFEGPREAGVAWIIDPIDGTVNYVNGFPFCAVSIACVVEGEVFAGVVHNPFTGEYFYTQRGLGAWVNESRIRVSRTPSLPEALLSCAFSSRTNPHRDREYLAFGRLNDLSRGCLRTGSAAMNLAYTASGKFSATWGRKLKIWDVAAGLLLVKEAGGCVTMDAPIHVPDAPTVSCIVSNGLIHDLLRREVAELIAETHGPHL